MLQLHKEHPQFAYGDAHEFVYLLNPRYSGSRTSLKTCWKVKERLYIYNINNSLLKKKETYLEYHDIRLYSFKEQKDHTYPYQMVIFRYNIIHAVVDFGQKQMAQAKGIHIASFFNYS